MKTKLFSFLLGLGVLAGSASAITISVVPTAGERLIIRNSSKRTWVCPYTVQGEVNNFSFDAEAGDIIYLYQTDRTCYQDYGFYGFQVSNADGVYEVSF